MSTAFCNYVQPPVDGHYAWTDPYIGGREVAILCITLLWKWSPEARIDVLHHGASTVQVLEQEEYQGKLVQ